MNTFIHFRENNTHRILSVEGVYVHEKVKAILAHNNITVDEGRFLLVYKNQKQKETTDD